MKIKIKREHFSEIGVYSIINTKNNLQYIGSTTTSFYKRWVSYLNNYKQRVNKKLSNAIEKYGIDSFIFTLIEVTTKENAREREEFYIRTLNTVECGYNIKYCCVGGNGGANRGKKYPKPSADVVKRRGIGISKALKGKPKTYEHGRAISAAKKGCKPPHALVVVLYDTVTNSELTFSSASAASKKLGCSLQQVCSLVNGVSKKLMKRYITRQTSESLQEIPA